MGMGLGQRIREVRLKKKLTQNDVVGEYMTRNMLSKIENGSATPSVKTLEYLAHVLDVPVSYFLDEEENGLSAGQLRIIEELAEEASAMEGGALGLMLCIRARARLAAGRPDEALEIFNNYKDTRWNSEILPHINMLMEDCYREKGDYKQAYEYAIKRLEKV